MTAATPTADHPSTTDPTETTMSTLTAAPTTTTSGKIRTRDVIRGEWIKFWSVRSTSITLVAAAVATVAFGMIFSAVADSDEQAGPAALLTDPVEVALGGIGLTEMIVGVLGVLFVAGEYSTGLIRTTFAAVGRRSRVIAGKIAVISASTFAIMSVGVVGAVVLGQAVYAGSEATVALTDALDVVFGTTVYLTGIALIGIALGFILRSTAAGIATLVGGVFIGPNLLNLLPDSITDVFLKYLPSEAGSAIMSRVSDPDLLSTGAGYAVFGAWVIGLLAVAGVLVARRDA
ncbi:MAG: ABC transporter permease [Actinomycetota bacterium]